MTLLNNITFLPMAAALVVALTAFFKKLLPATIPSASIALVLQVIIWIAYVVAKQYQYGDQFTNIITMLTTVVGAVLGLVGSSALSTTIYTQSVKLGIPGLSYQRPSASKAS